MNCEICENSTWRMNRDTRELYRCGCMQKRIELRYQESLREVLKIKDGYTFTKANEYQKKIMDKRPVIKGLWLCGKTGAGKTAYLYEVLRKRNSVFVTNGMRIENLVRIQTENAYIKNIIDLSSFKTIGIDDIDKNWPFSEKLRHNLYELFDQISWSESELLITANMGIEKFCSAWPSHMADPLHRRLHSKVMEL